MGLGRQSLDHPPTRADLEDLPDNVVGEIIEGILYVFPRPGPLHSNAILTIAEQLRGPFQHGQGGSGGWWILGEPGIELPGSPEVAPDLAGWRRERLPTLPEGPITVVPDWICEVFSPSTRAYDFRVKRPFYARVGLPHLWFVDHEVRTLIASQLSDGKWMEIGVHGENDVVRLAPFEAVELRLGTWWTDAVPSVHEPVAAYGTTAARLVKPSSG